MSATTKSTKDFTIYVDRPKDATVEDAFFEEERVVSLPVKLEVCSRCEGHGTHLNPSIGEHAYSMEEFYEAFDDEEQREHYFRRGGMYDVQCQRCKGLRVEAVVDEAACARSPKLKADLALARKHWEAENEARREQESEMRHERMMCGDY